MRYLQLLLLCGAAACTAPASRPQPELPPLATLHPGAATAMANAGWAYDRYENLATLDANKRMLVADLQGPGIIRCIHTTRHHPGDLAARGVVLEIYFDDAEQPAVHSPLADFFGDGCNGSSEYFSTDLVECAPWSYNCYFPMPFAQRARVYLRNDTDRDLSNYSFVEWEPLPAWDARLGYFHATYDRRSFQLTPATDETFLEIHGAGHLIGRQFSVVTLEPWFRHFNCVMEGNNSVDIDGVERRIDYLGTEDSFGFSWGFQNTFAGRRSGMTLVQNEDPARLSIYRFHDHLPIRFDKSLRWRIDWTAERGMTQSPAWAKAVATTGCWVDYATVHYWYQDVPGGFAHAPLPPPAERRRTMARLPEDEFQLQRLLAGLQFDPQLENDFATDADSRRVQTRNTWPGTHPFWIDRPEPRGGHPGQPNPGRRGILAVHPKGPDAPALVGRRIRLPADGPHALRLVISGDPYEAPGHSDFLLQVGVHDGEAMHWFDEVTIDAGTPPSEENWRQLSYDLGAFAGKEVSLVVKIAYGGVLGAAMNEEAFLDEFSVR